jgi:prevent-host-death family protein
MKYSVHEAKTHFSKLLDQAEQGEDVIIVRNGVPVVRLEPIAPPRGRILGQHRGEYPAFDPSIFAPMTDEETEQWYRGNR